MSSGHFRMVFELLGKARGGARLHHVLVHAFLRLLHRLGSREESIGEFIPCRHLRLGDLEIGLERRDTISGMGQLLAHHRHHLQVMSPPIMSQPFTMSSSFISPPIMGVVWADAANAANAIAAATERPDKGRETWAFMTMLLVNFPLGVPGSSP